MSKSNIEKVVDVLRGCIRFLRKNKNNRFHKNKVRRNYNALKEKKPLTAQQKERYGLIISGSQECECH